MSYQHLGLDDNLAALNSPQAQRMVSPFDVRSQFFPASVDNRHIRSISVDKLAAGTVTVALGVGGGNVTIDGANNNIIVNDGTTDRVLIGYQENGF